MLIRRLTVSYLIYLFNFYFNLSNILSFDLPPLLLLRAPIYCCVAGRLGDELFFFKPLRALKPSLPEEETVAAVYGLVAMDVAAVGAAD